MEKIVICFWLSFNGVRVLFKDYQLLGKKLDFILVKFLLNLKEEERKKISQDVSRTKQRIYWYKEIKSGDYFKNNIVIPSNSVCFNLSENKYR